LPVTALHDTFIGNGKCLVSARKLRLMPSGSGIT